MTGTELRELDYPKKRTGKRYMTFKIESISEFREELKLHHIVENLIVNDPNHVKGAPVFLEP